MAQSESAETSLPLQLSRMSASLWIPQAIRAAAALGVPDSLGHESRSVAELASSVGAHEGALGRLMRALVVLDLCEDAGDGRYQLTELGACLRSDSPDSVRSWAMLMGRQDVWGAWAQLAECVRTGSSAWALLGADFKAAAADPAEAALFNQAMLEQTRRDAEAVVSSYDFSGVRRIVDIGGGYGTLTAAILGHYTSMHGMVFDRSHCRDGAVALMADRGVDRRFEFVSGDFFEGVPAGADAYVLKSLVHDWDDEASIKLLRHCSTAMKEGTRLVLIETVAPERPGSSSYDHAVVANDLTMLINTSGRERTESEYRRLLEAAGLRLVRTVPTSTAVSVMEARTA